MFLLYDNLFRKTVDKMTISSGYPPRTAKPTFCKRWAIKRD